jgi:hypothetical protein
VVRPDGFDPLRDLEWLGSLLGQDNLSDEQATRGRVALQGFTQAMVHTGKTKQGAQRGDDNPSGTIHA